VSQPLNMGPSTRPEVTFSAATAWLAEGARVRLVTCELCGAAVLLEPYDSGVDAMGRHRLWHERHPHQSEEATR
jgi:hypothetical protein